MRNKNPFGRTLQEALARGREWDRRHHRPKAPPVNKEWDTCFPIDIVTEAQGIVDTMAEVSKPQGE